MTCKIVFHKLSVSLLRRSNINTIFFREISFLDRKKANIRGTDWHQVVSDAEKIVGYPTSFMSLRCLLSDEFANIAVQVRKLVGTKHPLLKTARGFLESGKHSLQTRGLIVLLIAKAAGAPAGSFNIHEMVSGIYPNQRQLAEITEMIHTASLVHRGVVNLDTLLEGDNSYKDMEFGNKIAVLSGDFLLSNATAGLAELNNTVVVEKISQAIGDMMQAEFTKLRDSNGGCVLPADAVFVDWETQTFLQSGSLLSSSCMAALELPGHNEDLKQAAAVYGENVAYARQMHEDLLPFFNMEFDATDIMTSAPVIKHREHLGHCLIAVDPSKSQIIREIQKCTTAVEWCKQKCESYGQSALSALEKFAPSEAKSALTNIVHATTNFSGTKS